MIISIDGQPIDAASIEGNNLEEILIVLQERHISADRLVGDVLLNGESYSEDLPHAAVEILRTDIETLELVTRSPEDIAVHFLKNGAHLIDSMAVSLPKITEMFRMGDEAEANEHFLRFLESLHLLVNMLSQVGNVISIRFDLPVGEHDSLNQNLNKLADILTNLLDIQEKKDWIFLADLLEYELTPQLDELRELLPHLRETAH